MSSDATTPRRFAIALSFPGEHREYVEQVAEALLPAFGGEGQGKDRIFYDAWHEGKVIGTPQIESSSTFTLTTPTSSFPSTARTT